MPVASIRHPAPVCAAVLVAKLTGQCILCVTLIPDLQSSEHTFAGFSDPVYAEAYVTVHQYDIVLDVNVINRTTETLQNLCLELATMGDLKLVERPQNYTLGPGAQKSIR